MKIVPDDPTIPTVPTSGYKGAGMKPEEFDVFQVAYVVEFPWCKNWTIWLPEVPEIPTDMEVVAERWELLTAIVGELERRSNALNGATGK
jgi:hypothetical protein